MVPLHATILSTDHGDNQQKIAFHLGICCDFVPLNVLSANKKAADLAVFGMKILLTGFVAAPAGFLITV